MVDLLNYTWQLLQRQSSNSSPPPLAVLLTWSTLTPMATEGVTPLGGWPTSGGASLAIVILLSIRRSLTLVRVGRSPVYSSTMLSTVTIVLSLASVHSSAIFSRYSRIFWLVFSRRMSLERPMSLTTSSSCTFLIPSIEAISGRVKRLQETSRRITSLPCGRWNQIGSTVLPRFSQPTRVPFLLSSITRFSAFQICSSAAAFISSGVMASSVKSPNFGSPISSAMSFSSARIALRLASVIWATDNSSEILGAGLEDCSTSDSLGDDGMDSGQETFFDTASGNSKDQPASQSSLIVFFTVRNKSACASMASPIVDASFALNGNSCSGPSEVHFPSSRSCKSKLPSGNRTKRTCIPGRKESLLERRCRRFGIMGSGSAIEVRVGGDE